jgi:transposase
MVAPGETITMSVEELRRIYIVRQVISRVVTQKKAAELIGVSYRQTKRLVRRVREEGERGIVHRLRGRRGNRRIAEEVKRRALTLHREKYADFGPTLASDKLSELHGITVSDETLRLWLKAEGKFKWERKRKRHREWRQRKEYCGEMVQIDGSHHEWLEGRGSELVLMGYVDDATGRVWARFYEYEGTMPAMESFLRYVRKYGVPQSIYLDRHTTYKSTKKQSIEEELRGEESKSQFERAVEELGVEVIHAYSPQAKGRIERKFRTFPTGSVWTG